MTTEQKLRNLIPPEGTVDVVLDTDAYNEVDDQYAIAYLLACKEKLNTRAIYAAPFFNAKSSSAADGMEKSYDEINHLLALLGESVEVFRGSERFFGSEQDCVDSPAARDLASRADSYSPENPLYVIAIGAITNVASAMALNPKVKENCVIIWLGGHSWHFNHTREFNMAGDVAASRAVMSSGVPFVQLPCQGVVSSFRISKPELEYWFVGKNAAADYLASYTIKTAETYAMGKPWTRCIWDVTAVAWLMNDNDRFMSSRIVGTRLCDYTYKYEDELSDLPIAYVYDIKRDALMDDLIKRVTNRRS